MKQFKDFGIEKPKGPAFIGDSIQMTKVLNRPITIEHFRITESNFKDKGSGKRLDLQITFNDNKRIIFTGALGLMETIQKIPSGNFPFQTTIIEENDKFEFT